jgi:hypothetical protein
LEVEFGSPKEGRRKFRRADGTRQIEKLVIAASQDGMDPPNAHVKVPKRIMGGRERMKNQARNNV